MTERENNHTCLKCVIIYFDLLRVQTKQNPFCLFKWIVNIPHDWRQSRTLRWALTVQRIELQQIVTHIMCAQNVLMTVLIMMMFVVLWWLYLLVCSCICCLCTRVFVLTCKLWNEFDSTKPNTCISTTAYNWKLCNWMRTKEGRRKEQERERAWNTWASQLKWLKLRNKNINLVIDRRHDDGLRRWQYSNNMLSACQFFSCFIYSGLYNYVLGAAAVASTTESFVQNTRKKTDMETAATAKTRTTTNRTHCSHQR